MLAHSKSYTGPFVSNLLKGMIFALSSHWFVLDGTAFYVRGSLSHMEAFLLVGPIRATQTLVNAFIIHFPSEEALSAKDPD